MLLITAFVLMFLSVLWSRVRLSASVGAAVLVGAAALLSSRAGLVDPLTAAALGGAVAWAAGAAVLHRTAGAASAALLVGASLAQGTQPLVFGFDVVMAPFLLGGAFVWSVGGLRVEGAAGRWALAVPLMSVAAAVWALGAGSGLDALVSRVPVTTLDGVGAGLVVLDRETARVIPWRVELSWWVPALLVSGLLLGGGAAVASRDQRTGGALALAALAAAAGVAIAASSDVLSGAGVLRDVDPVATAAALRPAWLAPDVTAYLYPASEAYMRSPRAIGLVAALATWLGLTALMSAQVWLGWGTHAASGVATEPGTGAVVTTASGAAVARWPADPSAWLTCWLLGLASLNLMAWPAAIGPAGGAWPHAMTPAAVVAGLSLLAAAAMLLTRLPVRHRVFIAALVVVPVLVAVAALWSAA